MTVLLMLLLMISPIACILMLYRQFKMEKTISQQLSLLSKLNKNLEELQASVDGVCNKIDNKSIPEVKIESV